MDSVIENIMASMLPVTGGEIVIGDRERISATLLRSFFDTDIGYIKVKLNDFHICDHLVTREEWSAVMGVKVPKESKRKLPKTKISWHQACEFISRLNSITGWSFRLPTEYEWEYAARGGEFDEPFNFSGHQTLGEVGWFSMNTNKLQPVGKKAPNVLGLYDMSGNAWEWCQDWFSGQYPTKFKSIFSREMIPVFNPKGPETGSKRVIRGGGYLSKEQQCMVFWRKGLKPSDWEYDVGFRLAY